MALVVAVAWGLVGVDPVHSGVMLSSLSQKVGVVLSCFVVIMNLADKVSVDFSENM